MYSSPKKEKCEVGNAKQQDKLEKKNISQLVEKTNEMSKRRSGQVKVGGGWIN